MANNTPHPTDKIVGQNIRNARNAKGWPQTRLAEGLGMSFQQLQKYETAHNRVSASKLADIAKLLDVSIVSLFAGTDSAPSAEPTSLIERRVVKAMRKMTDAQRDKVSELATIIAA